MNPAGELHRLSLEDLTQDEYQAIYRRKRAQYPGPSGSKVAAICVARQLAEAIWYMLSRDQPFAPAGATAALAA